MPPETMAQPEPAQQEPVYKMVEEPEPAKPIAHKHHKEHIHHVFAPIEVMGDHLHPEGQWMLSYRYKRHFMHGNRIGNSRVDLSDVYNLGFTVAQKEMTVDTHLFNLMYGVNDNFTLSATAPYLVKDGDLRTSGGTDFSTESKGLGDLKVAGLMKTGERGIFKLGVSLPTGDIDKRDTTPSGYIKLPYGMQLGSGTYDLLAGYTWQHNDNPTFYGTQVDTTFRTGKNDNEYRLGNEYKLTSWVGRKVTERSDVTFRVLGRLRGEVHGADSDLNAATNPANAADNYENAVVETAVGYSYTADRGALKGHRFAAEFIVPVYQNMEGPQLETDHRFVLGWQKVF